MKNAPIVATSFHGKTLSSRRFQPRLVLLAAVVLLLLRLAQNSAFAGSATWRMNPVNGDWNTAANWTAGGPPNGAADVATFATSNVTGIFASALTQVNGIVFNSGASAFTINSVEATLYITGVGITNNSATTQNFVTAPYADFLTASQIEFINSATAGSVTAFTNKAGADFGLPGGGTTLFIDHSTASNSAFANEGGADRTAGGHTEFYGGSTADNSTFTNNGSTGGSNFNGGGTVFSDATASNCSLNNKPHIGNAAGGGGYTVFYGTSVASDCIFTNHGATLSRARGGYTDFFDSSTASNSTFINNGATVRNAGGGETSFFGTSTAGNATLIANAGSGGGPGGSIGFLERSRGGTARVEVFGNGNLDISNHNRSPVKIGSIEGDGLVFLGGNELAVGSNNLNTNFSGVIQEGAFGTGGSLIKIGMGKLILSHRNTYTGDTTIRRGKLIVNNIGDSGTGSGPVQVDGGWLGGKGIIAGAVTVGTGSGSGAVLAPGYVHGLGSPGALTIQSALTFSVDATYNVDVNSSNAAADEVVANGVTINTGAQFAFADIGNSTLPIGTAFTIINNTSATPIAGSFSNLPDGSTFSSNGNTYQVSYQGGDGNDLTLTVIP
jgi:autotransporter-associated beta strand protein